MSIPSNKAILKNKLKVEQSGRLLKPEVVVIDGCAIMWVITWPSAGTVRDYCNAFCSYILKRLDKSDVYLIFDRYNEDSIKKDTRQSRAKSGSRTYKLNMSSPLPSQSVILSVTKNKIQIIECIIQTLIEIAVERSHKNKLVVTGPSPIPTLIQNGQEEPHEDLRSTQEEADVIIIHQLLYLIQAGVDNIIILCDDTDVFVLLLHHYHKYNLNSTVMMEATSGGRSQISIKATVEKHTSIVSNILAAHTLSGSDTTSQLHRIGKATVVNVLRQGYQITGLGDIDADLSEVIQQSTAFMSRCYGIVSKESDTMSDIRYAVWQKKCSASKVVGAPQLKTLPPTAAAFRYHVYRCHLQAARWKCADEANPPLMDPTDYGWEFDPTHTFLVPVTTSRGVSCAPDYILQLIKCSCAIEGNTCGTANCSCVKGSLACTLFCRCKSSVECLNKFTKMMKDRSEVEETNEEVEAVLRHILNDS